MTLDPTRTRRTHLDFGACHGGVVPKSWISSLTMLSRSRNVLPRSVLASSVRLARAQSTASDAELSMLEALLKDAKKRKSDEAKAAAAAVDGGGPKFQVQTFNAISPSGLSRFPSANFMLTGSSGKVPDGVAEEPHAILLRSHKLQSPEVQDSVRAIARCGAGTNNIPLDEMTKRGIPVFNTPGANANSVKELALCGLFLAARGVVEGINHVTDVILKEETEHKKINARVEKDKSKFAGGELQGKTLAVLGLGNIGAMVAESALALDMDVIGFDPKISVDAAWRLPSEVKKMGSLAEAFAAADYVSINMPYIKGVTHHIIGEEVLSQMKPGCSLVNFARAEIVDGAALKKLYDAGHKGKYVCDFPDEFLTGHKQFICIPHLGASTDEAEDNCAKMAADQILNFLETGTIKNSVNFPAASLDRQEEDNARLCIVNTNKPGVLGEITTLLGSLNLNIAQQLNTSRDEIAYNVVDLQDFPEGDAATEVQEKILSLDGVISTRIIWTGSVHEGPKSFMVKA